MIRLVKLGVAALALMALLASASAGASPGDGGTIVFAANRAPTIAGEVMRIGVDGTTTNLSRSPALDALPAVSPDGTQVALSSGRGGHTAEYVVRTDGTGLRRVSPFVGPAGQNAAPQLTAAWSRDGSRLAVLVSYYPPRNPRLYLASPRGGVWRALTRPDDQPGRLVGWSPAGDVAYAAPQIGTVRVVDARGRVLLDTAGLGAWWSPRGRLAVARNSTRVDVYDAKLRHVAGLGAVNAAWSADDVLATVTGKGVLQLRRLGVGVPFRSRSIGRNAFDLQWLGSKRLRVEGPNGWVIVDARTGHTFLPAGAFALYGAVSADGATAIGARVDGGVFTLLRTRLGGSTKLLASTTLCGSDDDPWANLQILADGSAVYDSASCLPSDDIWSVSGGGGAPTQLTKTPTDETEPVLSPDGGLVAYSAKLTASRCDGCTETLWTMRADGTGARPFPNGPDPDVNYDDSPTFSPDGKTILFARSGPNAASLYTVPAAGGAAKPLGTAGLDPVWGPAKIAYENLKDGLTVADSDGRHPTVLHLDGTPAWSQTGRLAVLRTSAPDGGLSIYLTDTKRSIPLPGLTASYLRPGLGWSPDGTRLAFDAVDASGIADLWTIGADGTGLTRVTHDLGVVGTLSWR
jgi:Tol biopolymer transport system component